ncbi:MAG: hypothetical protein Q9167_001703 [Letrouitia subvulpina]
MSAPRNFHHPFKPYAIQYELMTAIYDCLSDGQIGIFESPTGTGKSLSLLCAALSWLREHQRERFEEQVGLNKDGEERTWIVEQSRSQRRETLIQQYAENENRLHRIREVEQRQREQYEGSEPVGKKIKVRHSSSFKHSNEENQFMLQDYDSDQEENSNQSSKQDVAGKGLSVRSLQLMQKLGLSTPSNDEVCYQDEIKIFYCSRTHSQLTQFVDEIRRVKLPKAVEFDSALTSSNSLQDEAVIKHLPLGSRKNLCINPDVVKLGSLSGINERCLDLQQPNTPGDRKCPYLPNKENETLVNDLRDHTFAKIRDIEDLGLLGKKIGICPYYSARASIKPSELVTLPYPLLLQRSAREALGISLKNNVVIIDEAHNLMDTICNLHSVTISNTQLKRCRSQLGIYLQKFRNRLKGKNRVYITQLIRLIDSISAYLDGKAINSAQIEGTAIFSDLMSGKGVDQINMYKLMRYLAESKLAYKVDGYVSFAESAADTGSQRRVSGSPVLLHAQSFFQTLTNPASEGRFFFQRVDNDDTVLKYTLLDPSHHFRDVVEEARSVVLAGGTMSPVDDYVRHLFTYVNPPRLRTWSCGHIIPEDNLSVWPVAKGVGGVELDFTYEKRTSPSLANALGECLISLATTIPDGLIVFFPSYSYVDHLVASWQKGLTKSRSIWDKLYEKKTIFRESKDSKIVDEALQQYSEAIDQGTGGLLLSVIGGKMSEGINFSDKLGRGVVVVGLPFPNIRNAQWKAKLEYVEKSMIERGASCNDGKAAAREFYENACMRAVNQSIGRAIRHQRDYASIILLDRRFGTPRIADKLPGWIKQGIKEGRSDNKFDEIIPNLRRFFESKSHR